MAPVRCFYRNCTKNSKTKSMFSFPVDEDVRLNAWIKNLDNDLLKTLTRQELRHRYICEDHFDANEVAKHQWGSILSSNAVPLPFNFDTNPQKPMIPRKCYYRNCRNTSKTHSLHRFPTKDKQRLQMWIKNSGNPKLAKCKPESLYTRNLCSDHFDQCYKNFDGQTRLLRTAVPRPYIGEESNIESEDAVETECQNSGNQCHAVESGDTDTNYVAFGSSCMECKKPIMGFGFQWWCLQCVGPRCSVCIMRMVHRPHFVLRLPAKIKPKQVEIVITVIQKELQREGYFTAEEDQDLDQGETADVDSDELDQTLNEPSVKAEPPDEEEDPLAECFNSPDSQTKETPTIDGSFLAEHRPDSQSNGLRPGKNSSLDDLLETPTDMQKCPSRNDLHRPYRPSKSLGLVKSVQHGLTKKSSSVDNTECSTQKSSDPEDSIDYQPNEPIGFQISIDYQSIDVPLGLEYSFELQSQFLGIYGLYVQPDFDDIRHSASLNSATVGPVALIPVDVLNPDKTGLKISGSGCGLGTPSVQSGSGLQKPGSQQPTIKDLNQNLNTNEDPMNDPLNDPQTTQRLNNSVTFGHEDKKSRDNIKQQNNQTKTQQLLNQVYSGHKNRSSMDITERRDNKKLNTTEISKSDTNKIQEPRILVYSAHKKQHCDITEQKQAKDDSKTKPQFQVYSSHKKLNCTDIGDTKKHQTVSKMQQAITEKDNQIKTQFQVYSTHKARKPEI